MPRTLVAESREQVEISLATAFERSYGSNDEIGTNGKLPLKKIRAINSWLVVKVLITTPFGRRTSGLIVMFVLFW